MKLKICKAYFRDSEIAQMENGKWKVKTFNFQLSTFNSEGGQTLVEAIVAIAIAVVIVTALVTLGIGTQRAANTSRNQNQNTRYGEETLEIIRSIRDLSIAGSIRGTTAYSCNPDCKFVDLFNRNLGATGLTFHLVRNGSCSGGVTCNQLCRDNAVYCTGQTNQISGGTIPYTRTIKIYDSGSLGGNDPYNKVLFVDVTITWTDSAGAHNSVSTTKFTTYR